MTNELRYARGNIKLLLMSKGWTQGKLCEKTGITPVTMHRRLNVDPNKWTMTEAISVSHVLGMPVQDIFLTELLLRSNESEKAS